MNFTVGSASTVLTSPKFCLDNLPNASPVVWKNIAMTNILCPAVLKTHKVGLAG